MITGFDASLLPCSPERCGCGRVHPVSTGSVLIGPGQISRAGAAAAEAGMAGKALLVADRNTWEAAGGQTEQALAASGFGVARFVFNDEELHTDEYAVGSVMMALEDGVTFLCAVGSGTLNDCCRFVARRMGLPYMVVGTAPSMDGYASDVSPAVRGGFKVTFRGVPPFAIVGDTDVLKRAPMGMLAAGFGDVFGKITARLDWLLANRLVGEYRCERVAGVMERAVAECVMAAPGLPARNEQAVERLMRGLVISGVAMQMVGDSRPASGAEHHVAHFLEMRDLARGRKATLHGDKVGLAELMMLRLYEKFFAPAGPEALPMPGRDAWESAMRRDLGGFAATVLGQGMSAGYYDGALRGQVLEGAAAQWQAMRAEAGALAAARRSGEENIRAASGPVRPSDLGYGREDVRCALRYAMELRNRFTVLRLAQLSGRLEGLAEELADEFC